MKTLLRVLAEREQITESALVRQLLEVTLRMSAKEGFPKLDALEKVSRGCAVQHPASTRRPDPAVRPSNGPAHAFSHIRCRLGPVAPSESGAPPKEELLALKRSVAELGAIGGTSSNRACP